MTYLSHAVQSVTGEMHIQPVRLLKWSSFGPSQTMSGRQSAMPAMLLQHADLEAVHADCNTLTGLHLQHRAHRQWPSMVTVNSTHKLVTAQEHRESCPALDAPFVNLV